MRFRELTKIKFGITGNARQFQLDGWSFPEDCFTWSIGSHATLRLPRSGVIGGAYIFIRLSPFLNQPELQYQRLVIELDDIVVFEGLCWGDLRLAVWHIFEQCDNEFSILRLKFADAARPSSFKGDDNRELSFRWRSVSLVCCERDLPPLRWGNKNTSISFRKPSLRTTLDTWAEIELTPWHIHPPNRLECEFIFAHLNATTHWSALYRFSHNEVAFIPKPSSVDVDKVVYDRAQTYLSFFQSVAKLLSPDFECTICVCVADYPMRVKEVPIFAFQKTVGMETILLPDIDFLQHDFFVDPRYQDRRRYSKKIPKAVFAGSTTGGPITAEVATSASLPRLRAATYFAESVHVDFILPSIVQCISEEAEAILRSKSFCRQKKLTWEDQLQYRFQISIDGNGAACSRVALSLACNSALLKYDSFERLFYFHGLTKWVHFIPISRDSDVDKVIAEELAAPGRFAEIAANGKKFASKFLTREALEIYTAKVLALYDASFTH